MAGRHRWVGGFAMRPPMLCKINAQRRAGLARAAVCTAVEVGKLDSQQKRLPGAIVPVTHYDPKKERSRT